MQSDPQFQLLLPVYTDTAICDPEQLVDHSLIGPLRKERSYGIVPTVCGSAHDLTKRMGTLTKDEEQRSRTGTRSEVE